MYVSSSYRSYRAIAAAFESIGLRAEMLPAHDQETERLGRRHSSGKECNPYIMEAGSAVRMTRTPGFDPEQAALCVPSSDIGCRIAFLSTALHLLLSRLGYPQVQVISPRVSMETDEALETFGPSFIRNTHRGMLAIELLIRLLMETRPYEKIRGRADSAFQQGVDDICEGIVRGDFWTKLDRAVGRFDAIERHDGDDRPIIGVFGDDYTRDNTFANNNLERQIEDLGGEVQHVSVWSGYLEFHSAMKPRNMVKKGRYAELVYDVPKMALCAIDTELVARRFEDRLRFFPDPGFGEMMDMARYYVDEKYDPVIIIALARIINLLRNGVDAIVNVVGFQCTVYNIVSAMLRKICADHDDVPYITLYYDFQTSIHHKNRLEAFMHQARLRGRRPDGRPRGKRLWRR